MKFLSYMFCAVCVCMQLDASACKKKGDLTRQRSQSIVLPSEAIALITYVMDGKDPDLALANLDKLVSQSDLGKPFATKVVESVARTKNQYTTQYLERLFAVGADPNGRPGQEVSPLMAAIRIGNVPVVKLLLQQKTIRVFSEASGRKRSGSWIKKMVPSRSESDSRKLIKKSSSGTIDRRVKQARADELEAIRLMLEEYESNQKSD